MSFVSSPFVLFLLLLFLAYYLVPAKWQWVLLLAASIVFYAYAGIPFLAYVLVICVAAWICTNAIFNRCRSNTWANIRVK